MDKNESSGDGWKKIFQVIGALVVIGVVWFSLTLILDKIVMPLITAQGREKEVPDLFEMTVDSARTKAKLEGFKLEVSEYRADPFYPADIVVEQTPPPFTLSKVGRKIKVAVSTGEQLAQVPEVVGLPLKEALFKLEENSFSIPEDSLKLIFSDYYHEGVVAGQSLPADTLIPQGSQMSLTVSMGNIPRRFIVPELYAMNLKDAKRAILRAGLSLGNIELVNHERADSGLVVEQYPLPDSELQYLQPVNLKISIGSGSDEEE